MRGAGRARAGRALGFALNAPAAGQQQRRAPARLVALRGKRAAVLQAAAYGGLKDASAAWAAGSEVSEERVASMAANRHQPRAATARLGWAWLQPHEETR